MVNSFHKILSEHGFGFHRRACGELFASCLAGSRLDLLSEANTTKAELAQVAAMLLELADTSQR